MTRWLPVIFGELRRELFLLLLEFNELELHQLMLRQRDVDFLDKTSLKPALPIFSCGFSNCAGGFEFADL